MNNFNYKVKTRIEMTEKFVSVGEYEIRYLDFGNSEKTLVLIHGLGASAERWEKVIPLLQND